MLVEIVRMRGFQPGSIHDLPVGVAKTAIMCGTAREPKVPDGMVDDRERAERASTTAERKRKRPNRNNVQRRD